MLPDSRRVSVLRLDAPVICDRGIVLSETVFSVTIDTPIPIPHMIRIGAKLQKPT